MNKIFILIFCLITSFSFAQNPSNLGVLNINTDNVTLSWVDNGCNTFLKIRYKQVGAGSWIFIGSNSNQVNSPYLLTGLTTNTSYEWGIKCNGTAGWSTGNPFTTLLGCNITSLISIDTASCDNTLDGGANLTVTGGVLPYSYSWSNGDTTQDLTNVLAGTYYVSITDDVGCVKQDTAIIDFSGIKSITQDVSVFIDTANPNFPGVLTNYGTWAFDTLSLINTGCEVNLRPEFFVSLDNGQIQQGDFQLKWKHPAFPNFWPNIPYNIDANGNAYGYWSFYSNTTNDSTGQLVTLGGNQQIVVKVKFVNNSSNTASYGTYNAKWETFEVDNLGNKITSLAPADTVTLAFANCSNFSIDTNNVAHVSCNGANDGEASLVVNNGSGSYSYSWIINGSVIGTNSTASNLVAGTYTVIVTDNNWSCSDSTSFTITEPNAISGSMVGTDISCFGLNDGALNVAVNGGSGIYDYLWTPSSVAGSNPTNLPPGAYSVTVVDLSCSGSFSGSYTINEPNILTANIDSTNNNTSCDTNLCNGIISINVSGGTPPYSYSWSNGDSINARYDLCSGTYSIDVNDSNSCGPITLSDTILYTPSAGPTISSIEGTNISCNGVNDGSAIVNVTPAGSSGNNLTYCTSQPWQNTACNIENVSLTGDNTSINNSTIGLNDQYEDYTNLSADITPGQTYTAYVSLGSVAPYTTTNYPSGGKIFIDWNIDGDFTDSGEEIGTITNGSSNTNMPIVFTVPTNVVGGITTMRIVSQYNNDTFGPCEDGVVLFSPFFGATEDYSLSITAQMAVSYLWSTGDTTAQISNLAPGTYSVIVIDDNNGCTSDTSIILTEPPVLTSSISGVNILCHGDSTGAIDLTVNGGVLPYTYLWSNGATSEDLTGIPEGTYTVTATDSNGCTTSESITLTDSNGCTTSESITLTEPPVLTSSISGVNILCHGDSTGAIDLTVNGGVLPYTYLWSNGATSEDLTGIPEGTYTVTATDSNGCTTSKSITLTEPATALSSQVVVTHLTSCISPNGSIDLTVTGGTPYYSYSWNNGDTTEDINNLSAGLYIVTITDSNGCILIDSEYVQQPSNNLSLGLTKLDYNGYNISCFANNNGRIIAITSGGTGAISYLWSGPNGYTSTNDTASSLGPGWYTITITDSAGCSLTDSTEIKEPVEITSNDTTTHVSCYGGNDGGTIVTFSGGVTGSTFGQINYTLGWLGQSFPLLYPDTIFNTFLLPPPYNSIPAGTYPYTATDLNGCTHAGTITINQPDSMYANNVISNNNGYNISCYGDNDGYIDFGVNGGSAPYNVYLSGASIGILTDTSQHIIIDTLTAGFYTDSIVDANGCSTTIIIELTQPSIFTATSSTNPASCYGSCDGQMSVQANGGVTPYSYLWGGGSTNDTIENVCAGNYNYFVYDGNGCESNGPVTITEPPMIILSLDSITHISVYGANDGAIYTSSIGGMGGLNFNWSGPNNFSSSTANIMNLIAGTYVLEVIDSSGCNILDTFEITEPPSLTLQLDSITHIGCHSICNGTISISPMGGDSVYTFLWSGPNGYTSTNEDIDSLCGGIYTLLLSDTTYALTFTFEILEPSPVNLVTITDSAICYGGNGLATVFMFGGVPPYNILWDNGSTSSTTALRAGTYHVSVTDSNGCQVDDSVTIHEPDSIILSTNITPITCFGLQNGSATISVSGGIAPFQYSSNNGQTFQSSNAFYNLTPTTHHFMAIDDNGCSNDIYITLSEPDDIILSIITQNTSCYGFCDGSASPIISGGVAPYYVDWNGLNPLSLCGGFYNVTVTDSNGCVKSESFIINEPNPVTVNIWQSGNTLNADPGFASYQWLDFQGNIIAGANSEQYIPPTQGQYSVEVIDTSGCTGLSTTLWFIPTWIDESEINFNIYPNPTSGDIYITSSIELNKIRILNSLGMTITELDLETSSNSSTIYFDLSYYSKGIYFIQIEIEDKLINQRIILQ